MAKLKQCTGVGDLTNMFEFYCPACKMTHIIAVGENKGGMPIWGWNGDLEKPTLSPSVLTRPHYKDQITICHSFVRNGRIEYLSDCTHELAGQTVDMVDVD